ncbi:MAG: DUF1559 domain-containing protein [Planctomycetaceae bacterium]|jgi:hypothetical protein|nr:DUF1559 domain-containing protein [Planctomycetaceae bacterium]
MLKRLFGVLFVSACFLGTTSLLSAQETFAPLITDNCVGMLHVDLRKVEFDKIKAAVVKMSEEHLKDLKFDDKSYRATMRELGKVLDEVDKLVRPKFKLVLDDLGIRELAVIVDGDLSEDEIPVVFLAIPWENKTDEDSKTLGKFADSLELDLDGLWVEENFLFFGGRNNEIDIERIQKLVPSKNSKIHEALKEAGDGEVKIAFVIHEQLHEAIKEDTDPSIPPQVKNMVLFAANKIEWISVSFSLGQFVGNEKKLSCKATMKVPRKADAVFLRNLLEGCIDSGIFFAKAAMTARAQQDPQAQQIMRFIPLTAEYSAGLLRLLLPEVDGDRLVFSFEFEDDNIHHGVAVAGVGIALLLPAVQAARDAARRMQDSNKIRNITLVLHSYHDTHNEFPPLYTVDKNGKPLHSWRVLILPFMEQGDLYKKIRLDEPWDSEYNKQFHNVRMGCYNSEINSKSPTGDNCCFAVIEGQPLKPKDGAKFDDIKDGTSNTLSVVITRKPFCWMDPLANVKLSDLEKGLGQPDSVVGYGGKRATHFGFWDGASRSLQSDTDPTILKKLGTANGGETVTIP